jgi:hypothetical protein
VYSETKSCTANVPREAEFPRSTRELSVTEQDRGRVFDAVPGCAPIFLPLSLEYDPMSKVASDSMPRSSVTAPWPDNDLQDLFIEVVPELVDISRLAALATGEPEIAARLE